MPALPARSAVAQRYRLDNGLRVVLHVDTALPLVAVNLWYRVGSRDERPGRTGLAHLFEHMLFQGSRHVDTNDHFRYVQQVGGVANGSTWFDRTNYYETLPAHYLDLGLWLESDRMGFLLPAMTEEKLETQRDVVLNERRQRIDNQPYGRAFERLHEMLYPAGHPYSWPVIGYERDIRAASMDDVSDFFRTYYAPDNAVLTLAGDLRPDAVRRSIERFFGDIPAASVDRPRIRVPESETSGERREVLSDRVELARVYVAFRAPGYGEDDWYAGDLLARALGGGKSSPIYHDLVYRRQLAQGVGLQILDTELEATFLVVATANEGVDVAELERALHEHLAAAADGLRPEWIERARNRVRTAWCEELQSLERRADLLSRFTVQFDDPSRLTTEVERSLDRTASEIAGFAQRYLDPERQTVLTVVPV